AGTTVALTAMGRFADMTTRDITTQVAWTSAPQAVATVSNAMGTAGVVTGVSVGTARITATLGTITGTATITVVAATLQSIALPRQRDDGRAAAVELQSDRDVLQRHDGRPDDAGDLGDRQPGDRGDQQHRGRAGTAGRAHQRHDHGDRDAGDGGRHDQRDGGG